MSDATYTSAQAQGNVPRARPLRSRKIRPCDYCRRLKHICRIAIQGQPCSNCHRTRRECTFNKPAANRHAPRSNRQSNIPTISSTLDRRNEKKHKGLTGLLASLREVEATTDGDEDLFCHPLDLENDEEGESHYLDASAFALITHQNQAVPAGIYAGPLGEASSPSLSYRQVSMAGPPVYFVKNPSKIYHSADHSTKAEAAYTAVYQVLHDQDPALPTKLLAMYVVSKVSLTKDFSPKRYQLYPCLTGTYFPPYSTDQACPSLVLSLPASWPMPPFICPSCVFSAKHSGALCSIFSTASIGVLVSRLCSWLFWISTVGQSTGLAGITWRPAE